MPVLSSAVSALSTFYQDSLNPFDASQVDLSTTRLLAKVPVIAAYAYKKSVGQPFLYPDNSLGLVANFLRLTFGSPAEPYEADPVIVDALDKLFILHADHEQNCSTSTVRLVGSSHADLSRQCRQVSMRCTGRCMAERIRPCSRCSSPSAMTAVTSTPSSARSRTGSQARGSWALGHRVYKNYDPRASIIKKFADEILAKMRKRDALLDIALELESVALSDDYFTSRRLYPNVDFYTGLIYRAMGFPTQMFTILFAIGRLPGWIAQWHEMINDPETRIGRPRQLYTGPPKRPFLPISER
jgi:citrate synthase